MAFFLLFTQFRRGRKSNEATIFLFDEPAANQHSRAQARLLKSFSKIVNNKTYIIYSTHSHYMINLLWLEKSYIVSNSALDYDSDDKIDSFSVRKTKVIATK
jgi:predicted ATP-dependent endonuclease of OLD family